MFNSFFIQANIISIFSLSALSAIAQQASGPHPDPTPTPKIKTQLTGSLATRYHESSDLKIKAIQESLVLGFTFSTSGGIDLVGLLQTGSDYAKKYATVVNFNDPSKNQAVQTLYFKNLYLQKSFKLFKQQSAIQAGVLASDQKIGTTTFVGPTTAIGTNAWSEGVRLKMNTKFGALSVTSGSIAEPSEGDLIKRDLKLNYLEVQLSKKILDQVALELSAGAYDGEAFLRAAAEEQIKILGEHVLKLVQEGFWNHSQNAFAYSTSLSTDLGELLKADLKGRVMIDLRYSYNNPQTGFRGKAMNDLYLKGHIGTAAAYGKLNKSGGLNWFVSKDFGSQSRFQAGVTVKFQKKKK